MITASSAIAVRSNVLIAVFDRPVDAPCVTVDGTSLSSRSPPPTSRCNPIARGKTLSRSGSSSIAPPSVNTNASGAQPHRHGHAEQTVINEDSEHAPDVT